MSVHGLMLINTENGKLIYERDYSECRFGLLGKDGTKNGKETLSASFLDPLNLSAMIYSMIKFNETAFEDSSKQKLIKLSGNVEIMFHYSKRYPLVIAVFYSGLEADIMKGISEKLMVVFLDKYESKIVSMATDTVHYSFTLADKLFLPIFEDLIVASLKSFVLDLYNINLFVPWVYVCLLSPPKVPIIADSDPVSLLNPTPESASATENKANIIEPSSVGTFGGAKPVEETKMRSDIKGETLAANIERYESIKKMKLSSLLKYTNKIVPTKLSDSYKRGELCTYELLLKIENEELKVEGANCELSNDILLCESHQIYIKSCQEVHESTLDKITHLLHSAIQLLSPGSGGFKHMDFSLNKSGIELSKSRLTILSYKSLMLVIPTEALNEKVNISLVVANYRDFVVNMESLISFYHDLDVVIKKADK